MTATPDMHSMLSGVGSQIEQFQIMHERRLSSQRTSQILPINAYDFLISHKNAPPTQLTTMLSTVSESIEEFQKTDNGPRIIKQMNSQAATETSADLLRKMLQPLHDNLELWSQKEDNTKTIKLMIRQKEIALGSLRKQLTQSIPDLHTFDLTSCRDMNQCPATKLIVMLLKNYQDFDDNFTKILMEIETKHKRFVLDLYHHILNHHLAHKSADKSDAEFHELYTQTMSGIHSQCNVHVCSKYTRHRERERFVYDTVPKAQSNVDIHSEYYMDLMDMIHCNILHTYDTGMRCSTESKSNVQPEAPAVETVHNKYYTQITDATHTKSTASFDFGHKYYYWDYYRDNESPDSGANAGYAKGAWYIEQKYDDLQQEMLENEIGVLHKYHFDRALKKAEEYMDSAVARKLRSDSVELSEYCQIKPGSEIKKENLLALILYSDYTKLCTSFSSTFRKLHDETWLEMKDRNSEYWNWSKLLIETVELYGTTICNSAIEIFYHGVSYMTFPSFLSYFCGPTSTTPQIQVAQNFCGGEGLILELRKENEFSLLKYFNVRWISSYTNEDERLFIGGNRALKFKSIRLVQTNENYYVYIVALTFLDYILNGKKLTKHDKEKRLYKKTHAKIINGLLKHHEPSTTYKNKFDAYINLTFETFIANRRHISIHLNAVNQDYPFIRQHIPYIFGKKMKNKQDKYKKCKNLLWFNKIGRVFRYCESITVWSDPTPEKKEDKILTKTYLDELRNMLTELNHLNNKLSLRTIKLNDVMYYDGISLRCLDQKKFKKKYKVQFPFCDIKVDTRTRRFPDKQRKIVRSDLIIDRSMTLLYNVQELSHAASAKRPSITAISIVPDTMHRQWSSNSHNSTSSREPSKVYNPRVTFSGLHYHKTISQPGTPSATVPGTHSQLTTPVPNHLAHRSESHSAIGFPGIDLAKAAAKASGAALMTLGSIHEVSSNKSTSHEETEEEEEADEFNDLYIADDVKDIEQKPVPVAVVNPLDTRYSHIVITTKSSSHALWDEGAKIIWNSSCVEKGNTTATLDDLYGSLMRHLTQITATPHQSECRSPTMEELKPFFVHYIKTPDDKQPSIHANEFEAFYSWFHAMCLIISDVQHIYDASNDVKCTLFYSRNDAQNALSQEKIGTFLLRIGEDKDTLYISCNYKRGNKKRIRQYLFTRTQTDIYRIGSAQNTAPENIFMRIKYSKQFQYLYSSSCKKDMHF
eukprot:143975_1